MPPSTASDHAASAPRFRLVIMSRLTAPIEGSASPRKPRLRMRRRSSSGSFEVQWRSTASESSSALMPMPSSTTAMRLCPPSRSVTSMRVASASMAFSTSSFTADAGRSTTSPAAMRLTRTGGNCRMVMPSLCLFAARVAKRLEQIRSFDFVSPYFPRKRESRVARTGRLPWVPAFAGMTDFKLVCALRVLPHLAQILAGQHLAFFDGGLVEGVDAHELGRGDGLEHEVHEKRAKAAFVQARELNQTGRPAVADQRRR